MSQQRALRRFDEHWRLSRTGIVNVWPYLGPAPRFSALFTWQFRR
jgi:hypothetical protein